MGVLEYFSIFGHRYDRMGFGDSGWSANIVSRMVSSYFMSTTMLNVVYYSDGRAGSGSQTASNDSQNSTTQSPSVNPSSVESASSKSLPVSITSFGGLAAQPGITAIPAAIDVPLALWPSSVSTPPQSVSSAPILNLPPGMGTLRKRDNPAGSSNSSSGFGASHYYAHSTVPQQGGGLV